MISISKEELLELALPHGGDMVGGNIVARVGGENVWLAKVTEGVFALTDEGKAFVEAHAGKAAVVKAPRKKAVKEEVEAPAEEADDPLQGL